MSARQQRETTGGRKRQRERNMQTARSRRRRVDAARARARREADISRRRGRPRQLGASARGRRTTTTARSDRRGDAARGAAGAGVGKHSTRASANARQPRRAQPARARMRDDVTSAQRPAAPAASAVHIGIELLQSLAIPLRVEGAAAQGRCAGALEVDAMAGCTALLVGPAAGVGLIGREPTGAVGPYGAGGKCRGGKQKKRFCLRCVVISSSRLRGRSCTAQGISWPPLTSMIWPVT